MNDSYSVDFTGTPKPDRDSAMARQLLQESMEVLARSLMLRQDANKHTDAIMAFCNKYATVDPNSITFEERERICVEAEALMDTIREGIRQLKKLDEDYESVRKRVNAYYGKEIMKKHEGNAGIEQLYKDILDEGNANWWKKE